MQLAKILSVSLIAGVVFGSGEDVSSSWRYNIQAEMDTIRSNKNQNRPQEVEVLPRITSSPYGPYENGFTFETLHYGVQAHIKLTGNEVWLRMSAPGNFVAFGFHPDHVTMVGADIVVCGNRKGKLGVTDYHGTRFGAPVVDAEQDWTVESIQQTSKGWTSCEIKRKREVCNDSEDFSFFDPAYHISMMMSWGQSNKMKTPLGYHGKNRHGMTSPLGNIEGDIPVSPGERQYTVRVEAPPAAIPIVAGTEICSYHVLPGVDEDTSYHLVNSELKYGKSGPNSACAENDNPDSALICHHSTLISCPVIPEWEHLDGKLLPFKDGETGNCQQMWERCNGDLVGGTVKTKNDEGIQMRTTRVAYLRHFYNPDLLEGLIDTGSSFEITYTPDLRPYVATRFFLQSTHLFVPKRTMNAKVGILFPKECTQKMNPFKVVAASAHMHDRSSDAREMIVHHIREGKELKPLLHVENYVERTESESFRPVGVDVLPGDEIILECFYDNESDMDEVFGSSWWNQMCVVTFDTRSSGPMVFHHGNEAGLAEPHNYLGGDGDSTVASCGGKSGETIVTFSGKERAKRFSYEPYVAGAGSCGGEDKTSKGDEDSCSGYTTSRMCRQLSLGHCAWKNGDCKALCAAPTKMGCRNSKKKRARCSWDGENETCGSACAGASSEKQCKSFRYRIKGRCAWTNGECQRKMKDPK